MSRAKAAQRQREIVATLEAKGGKRQAFALPADVLDIIAGVADMTNANRTKALIFLVRQTAKLNPKVAEAAATHKAKRETRT